MDASGMTETPPHAVRLIRRAAARANLNFGTVRTAIGDRHPPPSRAVAAKARHAARPHDAALARGTRATHPA
ncbi:hypothetical protein JCM16408A_25140 [Methylobacterium phyllosphaerae]